MAISQGAQNPMRRGRIRALALCVFRRDDAIFVAEGCDSVKEEVFYRPLGGAIEFGEYSRETVARELREEIGAEVTGLRYLGTIENIFTYEGQLGHEIVLIYEGAFVDRSLYHRECIEGQDDEELLFTAVWKPLACFRRGGARLYPDGLLELLTGYDRADVSSTDR